VRRMREEGEIRREKEERVVVSPLLLRRCVVESSYIYNHPHNFSVIIQTFSGTQTHRIASFPVSEFLPPQLEAYLN